METYVPFYVFLFWYIGWCHMTIALQINFDKSLNESGRYLYDSDHTYIRSICSYCPLTSLTNQNNNIRDQQPSCVRSNINLWEHDEEENRTLSMAFCKQSVGRLPGCGKLTLSPNQRAWKVLYLDGEEKIWEKENSIVYHIYYPVCQPDYTLQTRISYRCGENRKWNSSIFPQCIPEDTPRSTQLYPMETPTYIYVILVVILLAVLVAIGMLICYSFKKGWITMKTNCKRHIPETLPSDILDALATIPRMFDPPASQSGESDDTNATELAYVTISDDNTSLTDALKRRQKESDKLVKADCESEKLIGTNKNNDFINILGAVKVGQRSPQNYKVITGCDIWPITRIRVKKRMKFDIRKICHQSFGNFQCRLQQTHAFMFKLESVTLSDAGTYIWEVMDDKKILMAGRFILDVIQENVRSEPEGCSIRSTDETEFEHTVTDAGMPVDRGICAVPTSEPALSLEDIPKESDKYLCPDSCSLTLNDAMNDINLTNVMNQLCYLLDPLENASEVLRWPGLARVFLKVQMSRAYIESVKYHRRGNPDNGPTAFILPSLCSEGYKIGHIVWYFSQRGHVYIEVLNLLADKSCHDCSYCSNALKNVYIH